MWMYSIMPDRLGNNVSITQISHLYADTWVKWKTVPDWAEPQRNAHRALTCSIAPPPQLPPAWWATSGHTWWVTLHHFRRPLHHFTLPFRLQPFWRPLPQANVRTFQANSPQVLQFLCISWPLTCVKLCQQFYQVSLSFFFKVTLMTSTCVMPHQPICFYRMALHSVMIFKNTHVTL